MSVTEEQLQDLREWVASAEGQQAIAEGLVKAQEIARQFREAQVVDPAILNVPMDAAWKRQQGLM